jgi:hypothetical protein
MVMLRFLSGTPVFLAFPPPLLLFALNLPCRLAAAADALSGMVNSDLLLLLHQLLQRQHGLFEKMQRPTNPSFGIAVAQKSQFTQGQHGICDRLQRCCCVQTLNGYGLQDGLD